MAVVGMGAGDERAEVLDPADDPVLSQEIEGAVGDGRLRASPLGARDVERVLGARCPVGGEQDLQHAETDRRETEAARLFAPVLSTCLIATFAFADIPKLVADIAPGLSLVARVIEGVGSRAAIVQSGASPRGYSPSPSEGCAMQQADVIFQIGTPLEPWLDGSIAILAPDAEAVVLIEAPGTVTHSFRTGDMVEADDDVDQEAPFDPHAWLDPENRKTRLSAIAATLSDRELENATAYVANATAGKAEIDPASRAVADKLAAGL